MKQIKPTFLKGRSPALSKTIVLYDNPLKFNMYHSKSVMSQGSFIPSRYSLTDLMAKHLQERNPLFHDL